MSYIFLWHRFDKLWKYFQQLFCNVKMLFQQNRKTEKQGKKWDMWLICGVVINNNDSSSYLKSVIK